MSMKRLASWVLLLVLQLPLLATAEDLIMMRSKLPFPEAMLALQNAIAEHGYTVSRVQRIDVGLTGMGYKTDKYRIVFAGKLDEIRMLTEQSPQLTAYLPPKISIFAENGQTILVTMNPLLYAEIAGDSVDPLIFERWSNDLQSIFYDVSQAN